MVKVLAIEGNRIKLSRKALIREQKAKLAATSGAPLENGDSGDDSSGRTEEAPQQPSRLPRPRSEFDERQPRSNQSTILIEGGEDFDEEEGGEEFDEENEPNFNRADGAPVPAGQGAGGRPAGPGGPGANNNRRRRRRRGGRPPQGG